MDRGAASGSVEHKFDESDHNHAIVFPEVTGKNLEGRVFDLPGDFSGTYNLVFVAFQRGQQALVDTWLSSAEFLTGTYPDLRYYELPTIERLDPIRRFWIYQGMRRGISDRAAREATITLYLDKPAFREALQIPNEDTIYIFLLDDSGRVLWRASGAATIGKILRLCEAMQSESMPTKRSTQHPSVELNTIRPEAGE